MTLRVVNDWETLWYYDDDKKIGNPRQTIKTVTVTWEDGTVGTYTVKWRTAKVTYTDMGHGYSATQDRMLIDIQVGSTSIEFALWENLKKLKVDIGGI